MIRIMNIARLNKFGKKIKLMLCLTHSHPTHKHFIYSGIRVDPGPKVRSESFHSNHNSLLKMLYNAFQYMAFFIIIDLQWVLC